MQRVLVVTLATATISLTALLFWTAGRSYGIEEHKRAYERSRVIESSQQNVTVTSKNNVADVIVGLVDDARQSSSLVNLAIDAISASTTRRTSHAAAVTTTATSTFNNCEVRNGGCAHTCIADGPGDFYCTCNRGYAVIGKYSCEAINNCVANNGGCDHTCVYDEPGRSHCTCNPGFTAFGSTCQPINNCITNNGGCHHNCVYDGPGQSVCTCNAGYGRSGTSCNAINTCEANNGGCSQLCAFDGPGMSHCACHAGFSLANDRATCTAVTTTTPRTTTTEDTAGLRITFQSSATANARTIHLADHGRAFSPQQDSNRIVCYGWNTDTSSRIRTPATGQPHIDVLPQQHLWAISVPGGSYTVRCLADTSSLPTTATLLANQVALAATGAGGSGNSKWYEARVDSTAGMLTLSFKQTASSAYTCTDFQSGYSSIGFALTAIEIIPDKAQIKSNAHFSELVRSACQAYQNQQRNGAPDSKSPFTGLLWSHTRIPIPEMSPTRKFTLFGSPKPLDVGVASVVNDPAIREQSITHQERTFYNWAHLGGDINAIMISDDSNTRDWAASFGLQVSGKMEYEPTLQIPTYRGLFIEALRMSQSYLTGMANADLLFSDDLEVTLDAISEFAKLNGFERIFVTGQRTNAAVPSNLRFHGVTDMMDKTKILKTCGRLFVQYSEDYFFVSRDFWSWEKVPPLVLGGVAFDNWLVNKVVTTMKDVLSVDATSTVTCIHQEHPNYSKLKTNPRSEFNLKVAKENGVC